MRFDPSNARRAFSLLTRIAIFALTAIACGVPLEADVADVIRTGTVNVSCTVTIVTAIAASDTISASVELATFDAVTTDSQSMLLDTTVKRSGNTATVTVSIPYKFILNSTRAASTKMTATVTLYVDNTQAYASSGPVTVPAKGTTPVTLHLAL